MLAAAPLAMRDTLLLARGMAARGGAKARSDTVANPESVLMRIIAGLKSESAPTPAAPVEPVIAKAGRAAALGSYLALFDKVETDGPTVTAAGQLSSRARKRQAGSSQARRGVSKRSAR
jgi:hypothetical protein